MKKIEKLTPEQEQKMQEIRDFWLNYIFSCKNQVNPEAAKIGIDWMYKLGGKKEPIIIHVQSPMACQYAVHYLKAYVTILNKLLGERSELSTDQVRDQVRDQVGAQVGDQVRDQVRDQVWAQVGDQVGAQVGDQVGDQVGAQVGDQVRDQVWAQVRDQVWDQVRAQVGDQVRAQVWDQVRDQVWAQKMEVQSFAQYGNIWDFGWVSFYDFFTQIGVIDHSGFKQFKNVLLSGIYDMIQLNGFCIVSNLPRKIVRNSSGRLHNPTGPAIEFEDGYCQYYINGRALPAWIWEKAASGEITREMFLQENNSEIKGGIYEVLGQKRMMDMLGAEEVDAQTIAHRNGDIETVSLLKTTDRFPEIDNQPFAWVKMICPSTGTQYLQGVEPHHTNALDAIASLSLFKTKDYSFDLRS